MALPGSVVPAGDDWIVRELRDLRQMIDRQSAARSAEATAIGAGGIRSEDFDGTGPDDPGSVGWMIGRLAGQESYLVMNGRLVVTGVTSIAGLLAIVGALTVSGETAITGPLSVEGATTVSGALGVTGATTLGGATSITGNTLVTGDLDVSGALDVGGTATVTGNLQSSNYVAGTSGYRLTPTTIEMNDLAIKAQAVPDAALAHIIKGDARNTYATGTYGVGAYSLATLTFTVPADVSRVSVMGASSVTVAAGTSLVDVATVISTDVGYGAWDTPDATTGTAFIGSTHARDIAVTPGGTFTVYTQVGVLSAGTQVYVSTSATAIFYR